jgi:hypothetical protein
MLGRVRSSWASPLRVVEPPKNQMRRFRRGSGETLLLSVTRSPEAAVYRV